MEGKGIVDTAMLDDGSPSKLPLILDLSSWVVEALGDGGFGVWQSRAWDRKYYRPWGIGRWLCWKLLGV